jgi:HEPN domain-containing protein
MMAGASASNLGIERTTPSSSRDFQKAALQRLTTAEFLFKNGYNLDAKYLAGYAIECALKALLLEVTPQADRARTLELISSGAKMHKPEILGDKLKDLKRPIPLGLVQKFRRFAWSTDLRYQTGRTKSAETGGFLKAAKETCEWVKGQLA